jgi:hypothetical protein
MHVKNTSKNGHFKVIYCSKTAGFAALRLGVRTFSTEMNGDNFRLGLRGGKFCFPLRGVRLPAVERN